MRSYLVLAVESDVDRISTERFEDAGVAPVFCHTIDALPSLHDLDVVVFAMSETSICSTAYQFLVLTVVDTVPASVPKWLLMLDQVELPPGFAAIRELPELNPG